MKPTIDKSHLAFNIAHEFVVVDCIKWISILLLRAIGDNALKLIVIRLVEVLSLLKFSLHLIQLSCKLGHVDVDLEVSYFPAYFQKFYDV